MFQQPVSDVSAALRFLVSRRMAVVDDTGASVGGQLGANSLRAMKRLLAKA